MQGVKWVLEEIFREICGFFVTFDILVRLYIIVSKEYAGVL